MKDSPEEALMDEKLLFGIILVDAIYLIAFAEHQPTSEQLKVIEQIVTEEPAMANNKFVYQIISENLIAKLTADYKSTSDKMLMNINRILNNSRDCEKILEYAIKVAMAGEEISPGTQVILERLSDALYL